ncbi:transglycosylase SLT domain-containing protein [Caldichromatium japonicum]|uniref:Transglycosylase SLT domain-containing protein n=1 Tax=Caldichromatium japonicum TaxID=2699430 RepID=A0A6G7VCM7_9GAMM|nr:transglycosylase SLT domain-containing protein [Caldichromatium japonicum]QIK37608.1 transglycosylase SLT domain-containing protein [Caldichromatium japonicum]
MPKSRRLRAVVGVLSTLALPFFSGCASQHDPNTLMDSYYTGSVSAREYGYVRPALDVVIRERGRIVGRGVASGDLWQRVRAGMRLDLQANERVDALFERLRRDPWAVERLTERASPYLPLIVTEIERRGLPMELAILPYVESRYDPWATSPKAAAGMWQFIPTTAREMGLRLDETLDERRDVTASTRAALDYLEQLHRRFDGDWELALAAYNCGPKCISTAIENNRRQGKPTDFWSLDLPDETRQYVPRILATSRLVAEAQRTGRLSTDRLGRTAAQSSPSGAHLAETQTQSGGVFLDDHSS